jgi:hypothetical protein
MLIVDEVQEMHPAVLSELRLLSGQEAGAFGRDPHFRFRPPLLCREAEAGSPSKRLIREASERKITLTKAEREEGGERLSGRMRAPSSSWMPSRIALSSLAAEESPRKHTCGPP